MIPITTKHIAGLWRRSFIRIASILCALSMFATGAIVTSCAEDDSNSPVPIITAVSPQEGLVGSEVTITGTNLNEVISVVFNGVKTKAKTKTKDQITVLVPAGASTGKIKLTYDAGHVESSDNFTITFRQVVVSRFDEASVETVWPVSDDAGEITISEFPSDGGNVYLHLKGSDVNGNYWVGGRYHNTGNPATPFGVQETDPSKVFFNVKCKSNVTIDPNAPPMAKLVFYVYDETQDSKKMNWEIDFPVTWSDWKTISISANNFHRWNGSGFSPFSGDIASVSEVALYLTGGSTSVYDFSFDDVIFSESTALGTIITP